MSHAVGLRISHWLATQKKVSNRLASFTEVPVRAWTLAVDPQASSAAAALIASDRAAQDLCFAVGLDTARILRATGRDGVPLLCVVAPPTRRGHLVGSRLKGRGLSVPLGVRLDLPPIGPPDKLLARLTAWIHFDRKPNPHLRLIGASGYGKTAASLQIVRCLAEQLTPAQLSLLVVSDRRDMWANLATLPHAYQLVYRPDAPAAVEWLAAEVERRERAGGDHPWLFFVADDAADTMAAYPALEAPIGIIVRRGRAVRVAYLPNSQGDDNASIGGRHARDSALDSLTFQVRSGQAARHATGVRATGAAAQHRPGLGILTLGGVDTPVMCALARPDDLLACPRGAARPHPWRRVVVPGVGSGGSGAGSGGSGLEAVEAASGSSVFAASDTTTPPTSAASTTSARNERVRELLRGPLSLKQIIAQEWGIESSGGNGYINAATELRDIIRHLVQGDSCG